MTTPGDAERQRWGATGFADGAGYDANRPGYQPEAIEWLLGSLGVRSGDPVVDLGAGSGKFTRHLLAAGASVTAVEPSAGMRDELVRQLGSGGDDHLTVVAGDDRSIPVGDASQAAVYAAQAFHWFDPEPALTEMARVVRPGGGVGLVWNERDEAEPWIVELHHAMEWDVRAPYRVGRDFGLELGQGPFGDVERRQFRFRQVLDHDAVIRRVTTTSYIAVMGEGAERAALLERVRAVLAPLPSPVAMPYVTDAYVARLAP